MTCIYFYIHVIYFVYMVHTIHILNLYRSTITEILAHHTHFKQENVNSGDPASIYIIQQDFSILGNLCYKFLLQLNNTPIFYFLSTE